MKELAGTVICKIRLNIGQHNLKASWVLSSGGGRGSAPVETRTRHMTNLSIAEGSNAIDIACVELCFRQPPQRPPKQQLLNFFHIYREETG